MTLPVACIEIGTTETGLAYSLTEDFNINPLISHVRLWHGFEISSYKVPSHLLIEPDGKTLHSFGFDAQEKFAQLEQDSKHKEWYYFRNIGMVLLDKNVHGERLVKDAKGNKLNVFTILSIYLEHFINDLLTTVAEAFNIFPETIPISDFKWVIIVPDGCSSSAGQVLRNCTEQIGVTENMYLCTETDAAAQFEHQLQKLKSENRVQLLNKQKLLEAHTNDNEVECNTLSGSLPEAQLTEYASRNLAVLKGGVIHGHRQALRPKLHTKNQSKQLSSIVKD